MLPWKKIIQKEEKEGESIYEDGKKNDEQPAEHANDKQPPAKGSAEDQHKRVADSQDGIYGGAATAANGKKSLLCLLPAGCQQMGQHSGRQVLCLI
jgi:hypothetical protein